jgi:hypothetical protein
MVITKYQIGGCSMLRDLAILVQLYNILAA